MVMEKKMTTGRTRKRGRPEKTSAERIRQATRERREQEKQELYQTILSAAGEVFLERGYEHFSLRQVSERIGYATGTIYLYFKDKDEVLFKIAQDGFARFEQQLERAIQSESEPRARLKAMGRAYITFGMQNPAAYQLMFVQRPEFLLHAQQIKEQKEESFGGRALDLLYEVIEQAMKAGVVRPGAVDSTGDALWATVHGFVTLATCFPDFDRERLERDTEAVLELIANGFRPGPDQG